MLNQFSSPISLLLIVASLLSFFLTDITDGLLILVIILVSGLLGFWQERGASNAMQQLLAIVVAKTTVIRDGREADIPDEQIAPGDLLRLRAGDMVPADCYLLTANELFVNEASLTGETFPVDKQPGVLEAGTSMANRRNTLFMGASVVSGSGTAVVVHTGLLTELGRIAQRISTVPPETNFEGGIRHFGYLLMQITLVLVILVFGLNVFLHKPVLSAFLFSLAIAVGYPFVCLEWTEVGQFVGITVGFYRNGCVIVFHVSYVPASCLKNLNFYFNLRNVFLYLVF